MTGRAAGYCAGYPVAGYMNPVGGRGFGGWGGGGRGRRNMYYATGLTGWQRGMYGYPGYGAPAGYGAPYAAPYAPAYGGAAPAPYAAPYGAPYAPGVTRQQELDGLKGQSEYLEDALDGVKKRIEELEAKAKEE